MQLCREQIEVLTLDKLVVPRGSFFLLGVAPARTLIPGRLDSSIQLTLLLFSFLL
jgi:hypothetical protein